MEDHPIDRKVAQLMLAKLGHRVDTVGDGLSAVDATRQHTFDVVLMSLQLPALHGLAATERIRAGLPVDRQPRIVAVSAGARDEDRRTCADVGVDAVLSKPLRLAQMEAALSGPMDGRVDGIRERLAELAGPDPVEDSALFSLLLRQLVTQAPASLDAVDEAARRADNSAVAEHAHSLKGSAANLGGNRLADLLGRIEHRARLDQPTDLADVARARVEWVPLSGALLAVADQLDGAATTRQPDPGS